MSLFDAYEIRARIAPAFIVVSPLLLIIIALGKNSSINMLSSSIIGVLFLAFLYTLSLAVRFLGSRFEKSLWGKWGGVPSELLMKKDNGIFPSQTKVAVLQNVKTVFEMQITDEELDAQKFIEDVREAFRLVRQYIRQNDPQGLWQRHNAEYGFLRNLFACWWIWFTCSTISTGVCGWMWLHQTNHTSMYLTIIGSIFVVLVILMKLLILPGLVKDAAFRYAESAWSSFLMVSKKPFDTVRGNV